MASFCLITNTNRSKYYIVPTTSVYQLDEKDELQPVKPRQYQDGSMCYVRDKNLKLGNATFTIVDADDDYNVIIKRNPVDTRIITAKLPEYSPGLISDQSLKKTLKKKKDTLATSRDNNVRDSGDHYRIQLAEPGQKELPELSDDNVDDEDDGADKENDKSPPLNQTPSLNETRSLNETDLQNETSPMNQIRKELQTPRPRKKFGMRRPYNATVRQLNIMSKNLVKIRKAQRNIRKKSGNLQQQQQQQTSKTPNFIETITVENDVEYIQIGQTKFTSNEVAKAVLKPTMHGRASAMIGKLWTDAELQKMYIKCPKDDPESIAISDTHCLRVKELCLYLQRRKKIDWLPESRDNIGLYIKKWIGDFCNEYRRKIKEKNAAQQ
ncbi:uncharacterized protein LOC123261504 isoform X2 [Cotesia glomerata]|uniref:uncharacterized protein LOC123261504 isoform X2 n=1 Tax=Cotesia glomerata TaxID=32391 RepID=UPI001D00D9C2|nr:uncharacterized protein LOC123261504 isoform X2 [Cotesia glomerata]